MYYAQLNDDGVVIGVTETHSPLPESANLLAIGGLDGSLLGHRYDGEAFHPPAAATPRTLTKLQFLRLFTQEERIAIRAAAKAEPHIEDFMALLDLADEINLDDQDVMGGLAAMTSGGLLAAGRAGEILA